MFNLFERTIAFRYLRSPSQEGFVSVIAGFSFIGIALGVATLIIVMAVMNGFRSELYQKLVGMRGHVMVMCGASQDDHWENALECYTARLGRFAATRLSLAQELTGQAEFQLQRRLFAEFEA